MIIQFLLDGIYWNIKSELVVGESIYILDAAVVLGPFAPFVIESNRIKSQRQQFCRTNRRLRY